MLHLLHLNKFSCECELSQNVLFSMMADVVLSTNRPKRLASTRRLQSNQLHVKQEIRKKLRKVSIILKKTEAERTEEEIDTLDQHPDVVKTAEKNAKRKRQQDERILEIEDPPDVLDQKCRQLSEMLRTANAAVVYTGAGISTAASIPDYRGPNGVWTLLKKGKSLRAQDLVDAEPTFTHMCITKLYKTGRVKYLVSQNCDGLHLRSGFPRHSMSEVHGNMFLEVCKNCKPQKDYLRLFDVTERTAKGRHKTGRKCRKCTGDLQDSIVHFGEKGGLKSPYRWKEAFKAASKADLIICLGSSLKVLRRYPCLWRMDIRPEHRPKLVIVNLQWTPKDEQATLKIHGRCDDVLKKVANHLCMIVPAYIRETDPLFRLHTPVPRVEQHISNKKSLVPAKSIVKQQQELRKRRLSEAAKKEDAEPKPPKPDDNLEKNASTNPLGASNNSHALKASSNYWGQSAKLEGAAPKAPKASAQDKYVAGEGTLSENKSTPLSEANGCEKVLSLSVGDVDCPVPTGGGGTVLGCDSRHITHPMRARLEQFLKERGVVISRGKTQALRSAAAPLPAIRNLMQQGEGQRAGQHTHPNLRRLLSSMPFKSVPLKSLPTLVNNADQEVFRVDLSTSPISITTSHGAADSPAAHIAWLTNKSADDAAAHGLHAHTTNQSAPPSHASSVRKSHSDHSYAKSTQKVQKGIKSSGTVDYLSCSSNVQMITLEQASLPPSAVSVIYSSSHDPRCTNQIRGEQMLTPSLQSRVKDLIHDHALHVVNAVSNQPQDRVVVNLNAADPVLVPHANPAQPSAMQSLHHAKGGGSSPPSVSSRDCDPQATGAMEKENSEEEVENLQALGKKKKSQTIPGWFGKGLRIKKKRTP